MLGVIKQNTGSTELGYYVLGGMLVIAGLVMLTLPKKTAVEMGKEEMIEVNEQHCSMQK